MSNTSKKVTMAIFRFGLIFLYTSISVAFAEAPQDIRDFIEIEKVVSEDLKSSNKWTRTKQLKVFLGKILNRKLKAVLEANDIEEYRKSEGLQNIVDKYSETLSDHIVESRGLKLQHLKKLTFEATQELIDQWLGIKKDDELIRIYDELLPAKRSLADLNISFNGTWKGLKIVPTKSFLINDQGGESRTDLFPNPGELITFKLVLQNMSRRRLFSSSMWLESGHDCIWVPKSREYVLPEMNAYGADKDTARFKFTIFASKNCPINRKLPIKFTMSDTHRHSGKKQTISMNIKLSSSSGISVVQHNLDRDIPGYSDGGSYGGIERGAKVELSSVVQGPADSIELLASYGLSDQTKALMSKIRPIESSMILEGKTKGRFWPNDDLDLLALPNKSDFNSALKSLWKDLGIELEGNKGVIFIALDVLLKRQAKQYTKGVRTSSTQSDQKLVTQSFSKKNKKNDPVRLKPLKSVDVIRMLKKHITIAPLPATPRDVQNPIYEKSKDGGVKRLMNKQISLKAIQAVSGYQVVFDEASFKAEYRAKLRPRVAENIARENSAQPRSKLKMSSSAININTQYQLQRFYLTVPAKLSGEKPKPKPKPRRIYKPRPRPKPQPRRKKTKKIEEIPPVIFALNLGLITPNPGPNVGANLSMGNVLRLTVNADVNELGVLGEVGLEHYAKLSERSRVLTSANLLLINPTTDEGVSMTFATRFLLGEFDKPGGLLGAKFNSSGYSILHVGIYF